MEKEEIVSNNPQWVVVMSRFGLTPDQLAMLRVEHGKNAMICIANPLVFSEHSSVEKFMKDHPGWYVYAMMDCYGTKLATLMHDPNFVIMYSDGSISKGKKPSSFPSDGGRVVQKTEAITVIPAVM